MRVLITGATGFVGRHLASRLVAADAEVHVLIRAAGPARTRLPHGIAVHTWDGGFDSLDRAVAEARPQVTFHLAAHVVAEHRPADIEPLVAANLTLGTQLAEALTGRGHPRLINTGSPLPGWTPRVELETGLRRLLDDGP